MTDGMPPKKTPLAFTSGSLLVKLIKVEQSDHAATEANDASKGQSKHGSSSSTIWNTFAPDAEFKVSREGA